MEAIIKLFEGLVMLVFYLATFIGYIIGGIFGITMIYLLLIRPIWGSVTEKGKRLYWLTLLFMLVFGIYIGPVLLIGGLVDHFGMPGLVIGMALYVLILWGVGRPAVKRDREENRNKDA